MNTPNTNDSDPNSPDTSLDSVIAGNSTPPEPVAVQPSITTAEPVNIGHTETENSLNPSPETTLTPWQNVSTTSDVTNENPSNGIDPTLNTTSTGTTPLTPVPVVENTTPVTNIPNPTNTPLVNPIPVQIPQPPIVTPEVPTKKGIPSALKIGMIVALIFVVLSIVSVVAYGAKYLKENHVPLVSGLTESILLSDGEQFSSRAVYLMDLGVYKALTMEDSPFKTDFDPEEIKPIGADKIIEEIENAEQINYDMTFTLNYELKDPLQPVLGIKDPGELNEDTITKLLSSKEGTIKFSSQDSIQFNNQDRARNITNLEFEVPGVNLNTGFETRVIDGLIYFNLDRFPRNDYVDVEKIEGTWLLLDPETIVDELGLEEGNTPTSVTSPTNLFYEYYGIEGEEIKKEDYDKVTQLINSSAVQNSIVRSFDEKVSDTNARCYVMSLTEQNIFNIVKEAGKIFDENYNEQDYDYMKDSQFPFTKSELTLCFAKLESYPIKVVYDFEFLENGNKLNGLLEFKVLGMKMVNPIEKPNDAVNFTIEDMEGLVNQDILNNYYRPVPSIEERSDLMVPEENVFDETSSDTDNDTTEGFYNKGNVCEYLSFYNMCELCTAESPDCQTCLDAYNGMLDGLSMSDELTDKCL
jgi:hypothetical protein